MRKTWLAGGLGMVAVAGVAAALVIGRSGAFDKTAKVEPTLEFTAAEVVQPVLAPMPVAVSFSGPLVAPGTAVLRGKAAGTLLALDVTEGGRVRAGQVVGRIDIAEVDGRVAERRALLESARAQLAQAERTHASNRGLADQRFISPIALEASRAALDTAQAQVRAAEAALATTRTAQREALLVAPIAGVVAKRHVLPGEKLSPEQPVLTIVDLSRLELAGSVGTHEVSRLAPGMEVQVRVEGHDADVRGTIARIAPAAEPGTRSIGVTVALANPDERFRAGQFALGRVMIADPTRRLTLPVAAIAGAAGAEQVWVIEGGALVRRAVTTGRRDEREGRVELLAGVDARTQVLAARYDNLREGARAMVVSQAAPVASAAASSPVLVR